MAIFVWDRTLSINLFTCSPLLEKQDTVFGPAIPVEKRVQFCWNMALGNCSGVTEAGGGGGGGGDGGHPPPPKKRKFPPPK